MTEALTSGARYVVERSIDVAAPPERVHSEITDFHRWTAWSPWEGLDPQLRRTYSGADAGVGAHYAWAGNRKAGEGSMEIVADAPTEVGIDLIFAKPFSSRSDCRFLIVRHGESSRVTWRMTGPKPRLMRLLGPLLSMDKLIGRDFEKGLAQLKAVCESDPAG